MQGCGWVRRLFHQAHVCSPVFSLISWGILSAQPGMARARPVLVVSVQEALLTFLQGFQLPSQQPISWMTSGNILLCSVASQFLWVRMGKMGQINLLGRQLQYSASLLFSKSKYCINLFFIHSASLY